MDVETVLEIVETQYEIIENIEHTQTLHFLGNYPKT